MNKCVFRRVNFKDKSGNFFDMEAVDLKIRTKAKLINESRDIKFQRRVTQTSRNAVGSSRLPKQI